MQCSTGSHLGGSWSLIKVVCNTVEALVSGHPAGRKKMSITEAGRLRKCKNTEFVLEMRKTGFCEGSRGYSCLLTIVYVRRAFTVVSQRTRVCIPANFF